VQRACVGDGRESGPAARLPRTRKHELEHEQTNTSYTSAERYITHACVWQYQSRDETPAARPRTPRARCAARRAAPRTSYHRDRTHDRSGAHIDTRQSTTSTTVSRVSRVHRHQGPVSPPRPTVPAAARHPCPVRIPSAARSVLRPRCRVRPTDSSLHTRQARTLRSPRSGRPGQRPGEKKKQNKAVSGAKHRGHAGPRGSLVRERRRAERRAERTSTRTWRCRWLSCTNQPAPADMIRVYDELVTGTLTAAHCSSLARCMPFQAQ
jgi:hypothetical protein